MPFSPDLSNGLFRLFSDLFRFYCDKYKNSALGAALELMGTWFRLPGRFLVTEDEFAKGSLYHEEIERIARKKYNNAIADGLSKETAEQIRIN